MKIAVAFYFLSLFLFSTTLKATITVSGVAGVSYYDSNAKKIYGGYAGTCAAPNAGSTCNTCTDTAGGLKPCNQKSIHPALAIAITFQSSAVTAGKPIELFLGNDTTSTSLVAARATAASTDMTLSTTWGKVCEKAAAAGVAGLNSDCSVASGSQFNSSDLKFFIGVDENANDIIDPATERVALSIQFQSISSSDTTLHSQPYCPLPAGPVASNYGFCFYALESGDKKLVIQDSPTPLSSSAVPVGSPALQGVAFYPIIQTAGIVATGFGNGSVAPVIKNFASATDLSLDGDAYIAVATNYDRYCVFAGQINLAQNIFAFTTTNLDANSMCKETSEVVGLLDDKHCFISTVAFGSDMSSEVQIFRKFRNKFLMHNQWGANFVKTYYAYGPVGARFISDSEVLKSITRAALYPLVGFSWLALNYGLLPAVFILLLSLIFMFQMRKKFGHIFFQRRTLREKF